MRIVDLLKKMFWENLRARGLVLSILFHLLILAVYFIVTMWPGTFTYDFGSQSFTGGALKTSKSAEKKLSIERQKEEVKPKPSENGELPAEKTETTEHHEMSGDEAEIAEAVDLSFMPGVEAPHMFGLLRPVHPRLAKELNIEANIYFSLIVSKKGKVLKVKINSVVLSKKLPTELEIGLKKLFAENLSASFSQVRFSPPIINGKNVPVEYEQMVRMTLE